LSANRVWRPKKDPWLPPDYDEQTVYAVRALVNGQANEGQQKLVWSWLMYVTGAGDEFADLSFRPGADGQRSTDMAEGKRFVGLAFRKMLHAAVTPQAETKKQFDDKTFLEKVKDGQARR
jgi:hypothetical protein